MRLRVKVQPRARGRGGDRLAGKVGDEWKLEVSAPPVEGRANRAVVEFFAAALGLPRSAVRIVAGERSRHKIVEIEGIAEDFPPLKQILNG